jgi:hypothetical protein
MSLTSKLKGIAIAGLVSLASVLPTSADAQAIMKIGPVDASNNFIDTVTLGEPFRVGVYLDSTGEPTKGIRSVDWDVSVRSLTNYVGLSNAQLPNHATTEDYFNGYAMDSGWNRVDGTIHLGYADDNVRNVLLAQGPTNTTGFLGFYMFTANALATNVQIKATSVHVYDTTGASVTVRNPSSYPQDIVTFSIIPEPATVGLIGAGLAAGLLRRRFNKSGKRGK